MIEFNKDRGQGLLNRMQEDEKRFKVWYKNLTKNSTDSKPLK